MISKASKGAHIQASRKQSYDIGVLSSSQNKANAKPRLEKSTSAALPKFISDGPPSPMKISQKLKRSLTSSGNTGGFKKDRRGSELLQGDFFSLKQPIKMTIISQVLELMGIGKESRYDVLQGIEELILEEEKDPETHKLNLKKSNILSELTKTVNSLSEHQRKHNAATTVQAAFRMFKLRKKMKTSSL